MANIEKHPAPEKILQQITAEAINGLELGGQVDHPSIKKMEAAVGQRSELNQKEGATSTGNPLHVWERKRSLRATRNMR